MKSAFITLHISIVLASFTGIFGRLITLSEGVLVWYRFLITTVMLYVILKATKKLVKLSLIDIAKISGAGLLLSVHWVFFYGSIKASNVSVGVVCFSLIGFFAAIFEPIFIKRKFSFMELLFSLITLMGILLIFHLDTRYRTGIILGIISSALAALFTVTNKSFSTKYQSYTLLFYEMAGGLVLFSLIMPFYLHFFPTEVLAPDLKNFIWLMLFSFFCTILLYLLNIQVLKSLSAFTLSLSYNLEPIYSIVLATIIFNEAEDLNASFYMGLALILFSVLLQTLRVLRHKTYGSVKTTR